MTRWCAIVMLTATTVADRCGGAPAARSVPGRPDRSENEYHSARRHGGGHDRRGTRFV